MSRLDRLLQPQSIAIVGATDRPGSYAASTIENLQRAGFPGRLVGVHPTRSSALGVPCQPSLAQAGAVDAVVIATPADAVAEILQQAAALGCGGCIVYAAGFAEIGRTAAQAALVDAAAGMPIIGPNGNGVVAVGARAPMWGDAVRLPPRAGNLALITQSGNVGVIALGHRRAEGLHTVVSTGNCANVDGPELLAHLAEQPGIEAIALYLESDGDGSRWCQALATCADREVRVVVLKAGRSARGAAVGQAHTAAIVGDHGVFAAMIAEAGGVMVEQSWQLLETARALAAGRRDPRGAAVVTCSGADAAIAADLAQDLGVQLADPSAALLAQLRAALPEGATPANPLDHTAMLWADEPALARVTELIAADAGVGHVAYVQDEPEGLTEQAAQEWASTRRGALLGAQRAGQVPLLVATTPGQAPHGGIAGLDNALRAIRALQQPAPDPGRLRQIADIAGWMPGPDRPILNEHQAKALAASYGIAVPQGEVASDAESAAEAADRIASEFGWPVVLKALDPDLAHKSEAGAVALGLASASEVRTSAQRLLRIAGQVLVEQQVPAGVEVLIAARQDGVIPTLTIGLGGIWTEALSDLAVVGLPAPAPVVRAALGRLRAAGLLAGARGQVPVDLDALCLLAERIGTLLLAERLHLVEANPVIAGATAATAVDLLIR